MTDEFGRAGQRPDPDLLLRLVCEQRVPPAQVGARLGVSRTTGYHWLRRYGITQRGPVVRQADLVAAWRAGRPVSELAAFAELPPNAIRERLVSAAVLHPERRYVIVGSSEDPLPEHLLRELAVRDGFTAPQIAAMTDTTARQVRYRLTRYRIKPGRPGPASALRQELPKQRLQQLYVDQRLSCPQIAQRIHTSSEAIRRLLTDYGITRRPPGTPGTDSLPPLTPQLLRLLYVEHRMSLEQIAQHLGYLTPTGRPSVRRVRSALDRAGITTRRGANLSTRHDNTPIAADPMLLRRLYDDERLTISQVAVRLGWTTPAGHPARGYTRRQLREAGIDLRRPGRSHFPP